MNWMLWVIVAWIIIGIIVTVSSIDKPRKTLTPEVATGVIIIQLILAGLVIAGGHLS